MDIPDAEGYKLLEIYPSLKQSTEDGLPIDTYDFTDLSYNQKKQLGSELGLKWHEMLVTQPKLDERLFQEFADGADPALIEEFRNG